MSNILDKYWITTSPESVFPMYTLESSNEVEKDYKNREIPPPFKDIISKSDLCYLEMTNIVNFDTIARSSLGFSSKASSYFTQNELGYGLWPFIIVTANITHSEAVSTVNVLGDTLTSVSLGAQPVSISLEGFLLDDEKQDHVYDIVYIYNNFLRGTKAKSSQIGVKLIIGGISFKMYLLNFSLAPSVNQGGYLPFNLQGIGYNTTINETTKVTPSLSVNQAFHTTDTLNILNQQYQEEIIKATEALQKLREEKNKNLATIDNKLQEAADMQAIVYDWMHNPATKQPYKDNPLWESMSALLQDAKNLTIEANKLRLENKNLDNRIAEARKNLANAEGNIATGRLSQSWSDKMIELGKDDLLSAYGTATVDKNTEDSNITG